jgi:hypothetical protein
MTRALRLALLAGIVASIAACGDDGGKRAKQPPGGGGTIKLGGAPPSSGTSTQGGSNSGGQAAPKPEREEVSVAPPPDSQPVKREGSAAGGRGDNSSTAPDPSATVVEKRDPPPGKSKVTPPTPGKSKPTTDPGPTPPTATDPPPGPPPPPTGNRTVVVQTNPPGAHVRLRNEKGALIEPMRSDPAQFSVPAGTYGWEVELSGYVTDRSTRQSIDVLLRASDTLALVLTPSADRASRLQAANLAFADDKCLQAIDLYSGLEKPADLSGAAGSTWLESRVKLGQCQRKIGRPEAAIPNLQLVLTNQRYQWNAKYELGGAYCDNKNYAAGNAQFKDFDGTYQNLIAQDRRMGAQALARYGRAVCLYKDYDSQSNPNAFPEKREEAVRLFDEFIIAAERVLKGVVPSDMKVVLTRALADAVAKRDDLKEP